MKFIKNIILITCIGLAGCASWHKYSYDNPQHEGFESLPSAKVPADLTAAQMKTYYPIPSITAKDTGKPPSLIPPVN
jgi:uncharacterized lipoprotein